MIVSTESELKSYYRGEGIAGDYVAQRFTSELHRLLHDRQVAAVQQAMNQLRPQWALEIAPGPGRLTRDLDPAGRLVCLEYNEGMIGQGQAACRQAQWVRGNGFRLPFAPVFDLVYSFRFVRHFARPDRDRLYAEIRRVLKPGGLFIMDAINERVSRPLREASPGEYQIHDELYRPEELRDELAAAGLPLANLVGVQKCFAWQYRSQVLLGPRINWVNRLLIRSLERLPWRDGLEWIVTCRRA